MPLESVHISLAQAFTGGSMKESESAAVTRARAYRAMRIRGIDAEWGLVAMHPGAVPTWTPCAREGDQIWVPGFLLDDPPPSVNWMCQFMHASEYDPESALFWLTSPRPALRGERPIDVLQCGSVDAVVAAFISHRWLAPEDVARAGRLLSARPIPVAAGEPTNQALLDEERAERL